jgi:hypothetical protein
MVTLPDVDGTELYLCAPCLSEHVQRIAPGAQIGNLAAAFSFRQCEHTNDGEKCLFCFIGCHAALVLVWAQLKLKGEYKAASRINRLVAALRSLHGNPNALARH